MSLRLAWIIDAMGSTKSRVPTLPFRVAYHPLEAGGHLMGLTGLTEGMMLSMWALLNRVDLESFTIGFCLLCLLVILELKVQLDFVASTEHKWKFPTYNDAILSWHANEDTIDCMTYCLAMTWGCPSSCSPTHILADPIDITHIILWPLNMVLDDCTSIWHASCLLQVFNQEHQCMLRLWSHLQVVACFYSTMGPIT